MTIIAEYSNTHIPCFTPICFVPFCLNGPYQCTLLNLHPLTYSLMPFGWLHSIVPTPYFLWEYHLLFMPFLFMSSFSGTQLGCKTRPLLISTVASHTLP